MTISRRFFLTTSCGAAVAVAASPLMITKFISTDQSSNRLIKNIIVKRFPKIDFSGTPQNFQQFSHHEPRVARYKM